MNNKMNNNIKSIVDDTYDKLMKGRLMGYQKASVYEIVEHFKESNKALLADEVGLGKTEIAKGVMATLVKEHWDKNNTNTPYRIAYICPNQNVAEQNYRKLRIYNEGGIDIDITVANAIQKNLDAYHAIDAISIKNCGGKLGDYTLNPIAPSYRNIREGLEKSSVFTRIWDWILALSDSSKSINEVMGDYYLYLEDEKKVLSSEWGEGNNKWSTNKESIARIDALMKENIKLLEGTSLKELHGLIVNEYENCNLNCKSFYEMNKVVARYLYSAQDNIQYRISMLHLLEAKNQKNAFNKPMILESLTPETSFKLNTVGNAMERALAGATYDVLISPEKIPGVFAEDPKKKSDKTEYSEHYKEYYFTFASQIKSYSDTEVLKSLKNDLLEVKKDIKSNNLEDGIKKVREKLINYNLEHINYNLVIMDEFQNYKKLLDEKEELGAIASKIFQNEKSKVLMLSATPFSVVDYIPEFLTRDTNEQDDEECIEENKRCVINNKNKVLDDFYDLVEFMITSGCIGKWKQNWVDAIKQEDTGELRKLLMKEAGIIRTERLAAAKNEPVKRVVKKINDYSFEYILKANKNSKDNKLSGWRSDYAISTPFALSFSYSYKLKKQQKDSTETKKDKKDYYEKIEESLFIKKKVFDGDNHIDAKHPKYEECQKTILDNGIFELLWIPPCNPSNELSGPYKGKEGISKTLIFARYRMTSMAITYLLTHEVNCRISLNRENNINEKSLEAMLSSLSSKDDGSYEKTRNALVQYLKELFLSKYGQRVVRLSYPSEDYIKAVECYCQAGCLADVLNEYIELLSNEYGNNDSQMANAVKKIAHCLHAEKTMPNLVLWDSDLKQPEVEEKSAGNPFAVGLYSEKPSDATQRLKKIKVAFNSPFLPFVFSTTSIGTEGIDLHWYARNIIHWSVPDRPVDIEQREGRVLRYNCHAVRLNKTIKNENKCQESVKEGWEYSGMYENQLNFFSDEEYDGQKGCFHVNSLFFCEEGSSEDLYYDESIKIVKTYRNMIGRDQIKENVESLCLAPWLNDDEKCDNN